jgi:hypothetical protein
MGQKHEKYRKTKNISNSVNFDALGIQYFWVMKLLEAELPEFNFAYYYSSILEGYRCFLYSSFNTYGIVQPVRQPLDGSNFYCLLFDDFEILEMAGGIDEFKIYFQLT